MGLGDRKLSKKKEIQIKIEMQKEEKGKGECQQVHSHLCHFTHSPIQDEESVGESLPHRKGSQVKLFY